MPVKVILKEHVESLGQAGDLVNVKPGYARNYLIPRGIAVIATLQNLLWLKDHKQKLEQEAADKKKKAEELKTSLEALGDISISAQVGPTGKLFGRVTSQDIADKIKQLSQDNLSFNRKNISIEGHTHGVEELGSYSVIVDCGFGVKSKVTLSVVDESH